jgi:poly-beta-1,6-N-acetyl-D-glucosamine synthase
MENYVIITPVRNEEKYVEETILSVIHQTILPVEFILVDDGSTDGSSAIIDHYVLKYSWIKVYKKPKGKHRPGPGVVEAFYTGFYHIVYDDWNFVVKLDADLSFEPSYFEFQLKEFKVNAKLGMTSGVTCRPVKGRLVRDKMPEDHVRGAAKMYRRACFDQIGGLSCVLGWDTIDELKAQLAGWETRSFKQLVLIHYKPIGIKQTHLLKKELTVGERQHYLGYHPLFAILRGFYRMLHKPVMIAGFLNLMGFILAYRHWNERIDISLIKHLRRKQMGRLTFKRKFW